MKTWPMQLLRSSLSKSCEQDPLLPFTVKDFVYYGLLSRFCYYATTVLWMMVRFQVPSSQLGLTACFPLSAMFVLLMSCQLSSFLPWVSRFVVCWWHWGIFQWSSYRGYRLRVGSGVVSCLDVCCDGLVAFWSQRLGSSGYISYKLSLG